MRFIHQSSLNFSRIV